MLNISVFLSLVLSAIVTKAIPLPLLDTEFVKPMVAVVDAKIPDSTKLVEGLVGTMNDATHIVGQLGGSLGHAAGQLGGSLNHAAGGTASETEHLAGGLLSLLGAGHTHGQLDDDGGLLELWPDLEEKLDSLTSGDKGDSLK